MLTTVRPSTKSLNAVVKLIRATFIITSLGVLSSPASAQLSAYYNHFTLTKSNDIVCKESTHLLNRIYAKPWEQYYSVRGGTPTIYGRRLEDLSERVSGVSYDPKFLSQILASRFPESPEFNQIHWVESRYDTGNLSTPIPLFLAYADILNDGEDRLVAKFAVADSPTDTSALESIAVFKNANIPFTNINASSFFGNGDEDPLFYKDKASPFLRLFVMLGHVYILGLNVADVNNEEVQGQIRRGTKRPRVGVATIYVAKGTYKTGPNGRRTGDMVTVCSFQVHARRNHLP